MSSSDQSLSRDTPPQKEKCFNGFFKSIFSIFRRKSVVETEGGLSRSLSKSASALASRSQSKTISPIKIDRNDPLALSSILYQCRSQRVGAEGGEDATATDTDGEYIIYIPRVSKLKLQRKYLEPLQRANYDPILIQAVSSSSKSDSSHRRLTSICQAGGGGSGGVCPLESIMEYAKKGSCPKDGNNNIDNYDSYVFSDLGGATSKTVLFFIPLKSGTELPPDWRYKFTFRLHEKNICWPAIEQRNSNAAKNRKLILDGIRERIQTYFQIWIRRRQVGEMKKKLAKDHQSVVCSPPNMLESRFHHIHWLGKAPNQNNSVGRYFDKEENSVVALKIFSDKPFESVIENLDNKLMAIQEIHALNHMDHKNIVKLLGYFELNDKYHLILESCDHCLRQEIDEAPSGLGTSVSKKIIRYILTGLHFCHQAKCLHRDLSPENILVCRNGLVKIADFDRSAFIGEGGVGVGNTSPTPGNYVYNSPEILAGDKEYGLPSDVWSLGIIFCEMLTGKPPWNGKSPQSQLREIHNCVGPLLPRHACVAKLPVDEKSFTGVNNHAQLQQMFTTISAPCCSFIMKCLDVNPLCRFTCGELLQHQFMKGHYKS